MRSRPLARRWSDGDLEVLEALAQFASREVALQIALQDGAERAELAQTLQESLLPPRLPEIPGLQVAARYVAGGTGAEVLGDCGRHPANRAGLQRRSLHR